MRRFVAATLLAFAVVGQAVTAPAAAAAPAEPPPAAGPTGAPWEAVPAGTSSEATLAGTSSGGVQPTGSTSDGDPAGASAGSVAVDGSPEDPPVEGPPTSARRRAIAPAGPVGVSRPLREGTRSARPPETAGAAPGRRVAPGGEQPSPSDVGGPPASSDVGGPPERVGSGWSGPAGPIGDRPATGVAGGGDAAVEASRQVVEAGHQIAGAVQVHHRLNLTPERPGSIRVRLRASVPGTVEEVAVAPGDRATVVEAEGFERVADRYRLAGDAREATLTYRLEANRTTADGGKTAVDAGDWALVRLPDPDVHAGEGVAVDRSYAADGPGAIGRSLAVLGPHEEYARTVDGQRIRLVVPAAAELRPSPTGVVRSLANASRTLRIGDRDPSVLIVAAPATADWAYAGQQVGDADAWVRADRPLHDPRNAWLHEYVHTRQQFRTTAGTRWLVEGTASYYAAKLSLRQGLIDFRPFRQHLLAGTAGSSRQAVLRQPSTWDPGRAEYAKGRLVVAHLDRRIHEQSPRPMGFQWVFGRLNNHAGPVDPAAFEEFVAVAGGAGTARAARRYTRRTVAPEPWSLETHRTAFGWDPPRVSARLATLRAVGTGGPRELASDDGRILLATDERLRARIAVRNSGGRRALALTRLRVNLSTVDRTVERVPADGRRTAVVSHRFRRPGAYYVTVGDTSLRVRVVEPARSVRVADVSVDSETVSPGTPVRVTAWVSNRNDRPAEATVPLLVDGEVVRARTLTLSPYEMRRVEATVHFRAVGDHRVAVGDQPVAVEVVDPDRPPADSTAPADPAGAVTPSPEVAVAVQGRTPRLTIPRPAGSPNRSPLATPGDGLLGALAAVAVAGLLARRRR